MARRAPSYRLGGTCMRSLILTFAVLSGFVAAGAGGTTPATIYVGLAA